MPLNIQDPETERLAVEMAELTGEPRTGALLAALRERKARLLVARSAGGRAERKLAARMGLDAITYAAARVSGLPLRARGDGFARTDVGLA